VVGGGDWRFRLGYWWAVWGGFGNRWGVRVSGVIGVLWEVKKDWVQSCQTWSKEIQYLYTVLRFLGNIEY
jgi:hypothetical protein